MFVFKRTLLVALLACPLVLSSNAALRGDRRFLAGNPHAEAAPTPAAPPAPEAAPAPPAPGPPPPPPAEQSNAPPPPSPPSPSQNEPLSPPPAPPSVNTRPAPEQGGEQTKPAPGSGGGNDQGQNTATAPPLPVGPSTKPTPPGVGTGGQVPTLPGSGPMTEGQQPPPPPTGPGGVTTLPGTVTPEQGSNAGGVPGCKRMVGNNNCKPTSGGGVGGGGSTDGDAAGQGQGQGQDQSQSQTAIINNNVNGGGAGWPVSAAAPAPPPAIVDTKCELIIPKVDLEKETTCKAALPAFVKATSDMAWAHQTPLERETSLDTFCQTDCGQTYTETLLARRRGCNPPTLQGHGGALVPNGPAAFPGTDPGLRLGCIIDPMDGQYCAMKKALPGDGECEFYMSCCYGELAITADGNTPEKSFYAMIDKRCPGSAVYRSTACVKS